ncbi:MAG: hypothetical protein IT444_13405 [Phycisphaeraceae bacterium]|nr:hypothetical protein [Phycisphaeraceae bacterium]
MRFFTILAVAGFLTATGCGDAQPGASSGSSNTTSSTVTQGGKNSSAEIASADKNCLDLINEKGKVAEAREWLDPKHTHHVLWSGDKQQLRDLFNALYDAGAPAVHAVDISDLSDLTKQPGEMTALFVVTLPDDAGARERVFRRLVEYWKPFFEGTEPEDIKEYTPTDVGQKYYLLNLDL